MLITSIIHFTPSPLIHLLYTSYIHSIYHSSASHTHTLSIYLSYTSYISCTFYILLWYFLGSSYVLRMYLLCTSHVLLMYLACTSHVPRMSILNLSSLHRPSTFYLPYSFVQDIFVICSILVQYYIEHLLNISRTRIEHK